MKHKERDLQTIIYGGAAYCEWMEEITGHLDDAVDVRKWIKTARAAMAKAVKASYDRLPVTRQKSTFRQARQKRIDIDTVCSPVHDGLHERVLTIDAINEILEFDPLLCELCDESEAALKKCPMRKLMKKYDLNNFCTEKHGDTVDPENPDDVHDPEGGVL